MVISYPKRMKDVGGLRSQSSHVTDIVRTILEATGVPFPNSIDETMDFAEDTGIPIVRSRRPPPKQAGHVASHEYSEL